MKKLVMILATLVVVLGGLLIYNYLPDNGEEMKDEQETNIAATQKDNETVVKETTKEGKPAEPKKTQAEIDREEVKNYSVLAAPIIEKITKNVKDLTTINQMSPNVTADYIETAEVICEDLQKNVDEYQALEIGYNKRVEEVHTAFLLTMTELEFVAGYYAYGLEIQDQNMIEASNDAMENSKRFTIDATYLMMSYLD